MKWNVKDVNDQIESNEWYEQVMDNEMKCETQMMFENDQVKLNENCYERIMVIWNMMRKVMVIKNDMYK